MKLSQMWKNKMMEVVTNIYGDGIDKEKLEAFCDQQIALHEKKFPYLWMRNLYTTKNFQVPMDDILDIVKQEDLCISGNNTFTYSLDKCPTIIPQMLIEKKKERNFHKKKMLEAEGRCTVLKSKGEYYEGCPDDLVRQNEDSFQLKVKVFMNSIYGVQGQAGSYLYAPDTAGAVTSQGRQLISEMLWSIERLLYGTLHFETINEFFTYLNTIKQECHEDSEYLKYITYYPSVEDVKGQIIKCINKTVGFGQKIQKLDVTILRFIENLTEKERIYFYYKSNLFGLYSRNIKVFQLFDEIVKLKIPFFALFKKPGDDVEEELKPLLQYSYKTQEEFDSVFLEKDENGNRIPVNYEDMTKRQKKILNFLGYHILIV